jgi:hypothetical protein
VRALGISVAGNVLVVAAATAAAAAAAALRLCCSCAAAMTIHSRETPHEAGDLPLKISSAARSRRCSGI